MCTSFTRTLYQGSRWIECVFIFLLLRSVASVGFVRCQKGRNITHRCRSIKSISILFLMWTAKGGSRNKKKNAMESATINTFLEAPVYMVFFFVSTFDQSDHSDQRSVISQLKRHSTQNNLSRNFYYTATWFSEPMNGSISNRQQDIGRKIAHNNNWFIQLDNNTIIEWRACNHKTFIFNNKLNSLSSTLKLLRRCESVCESRVVVQLIQIKYRLKKNHSFGWAWGMSVWISDCGNERKKIKKKSNMHWIEWNESENWFWSGIHESHLVCWFCFCARAKRKVNCSQVDQW